MSGFDLLTDTPVLLNGKTRMVRCYNGMTGIGSRDTWVDGQKLFYNTVRQTDNITDGPHFLYVIKWRDTPWDKVAVIIRESEVPFLLSDENKWREPYLYNL